MIKAINKVLHNGKLYQHGEEILSLTKEEAERLLELGSAEEEGQTFFEPESGNDNPLLNDLTTPEQFAKLKAEDQKDMLEALMIEPADKKEDRIVQYEEWYAEQVTAGAED